MNANDHLDVDECLVELGTKLRERPRLAAQVMDAVRKVSTDPASKEGPVRSPRRMDRWRKGFLGLVAATSIAIVLFVILGPSPSPSLSWADVVETMRSRKWIRGHITEGEVAGATVWVSPDRKIWCFQWGKSCRFFDGSEGVKYIYDGNDKPITELPLGSDSAERVLPFKALLKGNDVVTPWLFGTEKVLDQKRYEVTENGKTWVDFHLTLWRGDRKQAVLRVDPDTALPVYLLLRSSDDGVKPIKWAFDYPEKGPEDIYALGVPREIPIDDRAGNGDLQAALSGMAASRDRLGDFRLLVAVDEPDDDSPQSYVVSRKGWCWRIDRCRLSRTDLLELAKPGMEQREPAWFAGRLKESERVPVYLCDGKAVYHYWPASHGDEKGRWERTRCAPQDLLDCNPYRTMLPQADYTQIVGLAYPMLGPLQAGWFEFDPRPADAPGCVLVKKWFRSTVTQKLWHYWYYLDRTKGYAVVRSEMFSSPDEETLDPIKGAGRTIHLEHFLQSPEGFWYPTLIRVDDCSVKPRKERTVRYHLEFDAELPDSRFTLGDKKGDITDIEH